MSGNRLCAKCQEIISKVPDKSVQENDHHSNNKALLQAVEQNCYVCSWTLRDYRSRRSNRRQKPHIAHHTTYMWENKRIRYRASDVLEFELYINIYATEDKLSTVTSFWPLEPAIRGKYFSAFEMRR